MFTEKGTHPACLSIDQLTQLCEFTRTRSGGPGGQHRNKVETAVVVTHRESGIIGQAGERRSQLQNRTKAIQRLRLALAIGLRSEQKRSQPSDSWVSRCRSRRIKISREHADFACLLAEVLDQVAHSDFQISAAAEFFDCSTSQLIKFLKIEDSAFSWVNRRRKEAGFGPLK